jgi:hypothetical protein
MRVPLFLLLLFSVTFFGCTSDGKPKLLEVHDEVIVSPYAMDYTYLRALEAVQAMPDWELDRTDKEKGILHVRNLRFSSFADADLRTATLQLKRLGPRQTSIQFTQETQSIVWGDEILKAIKQNLALE